MVPHNTLRLDKSAYLMLPVMALAFYVAFIPHQDYPYLLHVDEWLHLAYIEAILRAGSLNFTEPFFGVESIFISRNLEAGFQLFWGVFHQISGISWLNIFRYFPSIIFVITILSVYILCRRENFGLEAAFFTCLIPTTVGILGKSFLFSRSAKNSRSGWIIRREASKKVHSSVLPQSASKIPPPSLPAIRSPTHYGESSYSGTDRRSWPVPACSGR